MKPVASHFERVGALPIGGVQIIESLDCIAREQQAVRRTWRERLLSLPWRPLQREKLITVVVPDPDLYRIGRRVLIGHPATVARLREKLKREPA